MADVEATRLHYYNGIERLRYVGSWLVTVLATVLFSSAGILVSFLDRRGNMTHASARVWGRAFLWICGVVLVVEGRERLDVDSAYVFVANHQSTLDIPALLVALPVRFRMLAKASLFRIPFLGWYMKRVGYVAVTRSDRRLALQSVETAALRAGEGTSILVFPEGTRTGEAELARFKKGGFYVARDVGLPVVPVALINSGRLLPRGKRWPDPGVIEVRIGEPIVPGLEVEPGALANQVRARVAELYLPRQ